MTMSKKVPFQTTLDVHDTCLCLHVQRAARRLARRFDDALRPFGLSNGQFSLLMALNQPEPPTLGRVAQILAMDRTTLTAALKPLERDGLALSSPDEKDKRQRRLLLTETGHARLIAALPVWQATHAELRAALAEEDDRLRRLLAAL